jgi:hypothetical protein
MNEKEGLNLLDFLATGINKADTCIQAIFSDENGEGAAANEVEELVKFINYYTRTDDVRNHTGYTLDIIVKMFSKLRRRITEADAVLLRRFLALTERKGDVIWGNALNLSHVFETYFRDIKCYVAENTNGADTNILNNGDFEFDDYWELDGGAGEACVQRLEWLISAGNYTFHFFLRGKCGVVIKRDDGKYWNANDQKFSGDRVLEWVDDEVINIFENPYGWNDAFCFIILPEDTRGITVEFLSIENETAAIDYARLFVKPLNPSYTLVFQYEGYLISDKSLHTGAVGEDPVQGVDYKYESYFDHAFIVGPLGISQSQAFKYALDITRPRGIQVFAEFIEREIVEPEEEAS